MEDITASRIEPLGRDDQSYSDNTREKRTEKKKPAPAPQAATPPVERDDGEIHTIDELA